MIEDLMPPSIEPFLNINKDGSAMVENPIHALLGQLPRVFISIDGLDEAEYTENHPASYAIFHEKQVSTFDFLGSAIETEVKGRFLWASLMLVELKNTADDDDDDGKIELAMRCLPTKPTLVALRTDDKERMIRFLKSPNILTIIQVQSLFVIGHFMQSFDPITDRSKCLRRTLPNWMKLDEPDLDRQYRIFQGE
ncbi:uncharacterized protein BDW43DRAFT_307591 [Aspergillus alliaceus]|uniref:uncharacterized protein n=1 Tax=Petromyces alliaceus TaxID=209559 RepID=UPI0012A4D4DB|nr:uncharacterized protein BDW43DRAFT_307591 [Aspergillus alliaceus]KAB8237317.1 hypothetical protein BDW43DRAFT_307591 [Aspergillus alliaceus]